MSAEWLDVLASECARAGSSQGKVAEQLRNHAKGGFPSASTLNQVLKGKYKGDVERIRGLVEGALMGKTVTCPVLGELSREICMRHQTRKAGASNPMRIKLHEACKTCPNRRKS